MASLIRCLSYLDELKFVETWMQCFATQARTKKLKGGQAKRGENEMNN